MPTVVDIMVICIELKMLKYPQGVSFAHVREEREGVRERRRKDRKEMKGKTETKKGKGRKGEDKTNNSVLPTVNTSAVNKNKFCSRNIE